MADEASVPDGSVNSPQSIRDARRERMFPELSSAEIERLRRFGQTRRYASGEKLFVTGEIAPGMFVLKSGSVEVRRRDPFGHLALIVQQGPGQFVAEVGQLSGQPALVDVYALSDIDTLLISSENLRAVVIAEADLGDRIMQALILRRVTLIEAGSGGPVLIGPAIGPDVVRLQNFLARNAYPYQVLDPAEDRDAATLVSRSGARPADLPLAVCPNGTVLKNPSEINLARSLGMAQTARPEQTFDVAVIGAGPGGLSTAVYAASEGLSVIVLDAQAFGGQAGASARIENYLGFPTGIPGRTLTGRAFVQAQKFGARFVIPVEAVRLDPADTPLRIYLSDGSEVTARTAVIASGARYRKLGIPSIGEFEGRGIWYWASPIEARLCRNDEIVVVGGGNSAGQAAVFLHDFAAKIWMLVREKSLAESMSRYLIDRINAIETIEVLTETEIVAISGSREGQLERVRWRCKQTGEESEKPIRNVFLMIGADPATGWLETSGITLDEKRFVRTGRNGIDHAGPDRPLPLESNVAGVFAVGDVRSGSVKRVGGAIGEGAAVVAQLHTVLRHSKLHVPADRVVASG